MLSHPEADVLCFLQQKIINAIKHSEHERCACMEALMSSSPHISAIILVRESHWTEESMVKFRAYVELDVNEEEQCEAELLCACERLLEDGAIWRVSTLQVVGALPLPKA